MSGIEALNDGSVVWLEAIIRASLQGGLALLIVWVVSRFVRTVPARAKVWLWRIAYCKLLFAFFCGSAIDLPVLPRPTETAEVARTAGEATTEPVPMKAPERGRAEHPSGFREAAKTPGLEVSSLLFVFWLLGVLCCGVRLSWHWRRAAIIRRNSPALEDPACRSLCGELTARFGLRRAPRVLLSQGVSSPVLIGTLGPAIILPAGSCSALTPKQLRLMLAHELAHLRRKDLLWLWLPAAAESFFFFHPLVWVARRESSLMHEVACDEMAVRTASLPASDYGAMLLDFIAAKPPEPRADSIALGMFETKQTLQRRLAAMKQLMVHKGKLSVAAIAAVLMLGVITVLPWRAVAQNEPGSRDEIARLKGENAKLQEDVDKLRAELKIVSQEKDGLRQATAELEKTKQRLATLLQQYTQEQPKVKETQEKPAALEQARKQEVLRVQQELARMQREKARLEELKKLIREEIGLVEKQLEEARKRVQAGTHPSESLIPLQREILKLKRELWSIE